MIKIWRTILKFSYCYLLIFFSNFRKEFQDKPPLTTRYKSCFCPEWLQHSFTHWQSPTSIRGLSLALDENAQGKHSKDFCKKMCVFVVSKINCASGWLLTLQHVVVISARERVHDQPHTAWAC